jgi:hypothetical protein
VSVRIFGDEVDGWMTPEGDLYVVAVDIEAAFKRAGKPAPFFPPEMVEEHAGLDHIRVEVVHSH